MLDVTGLHRGGRLPTYRMYRLDGDGRISGADWIEAADDQAAISDARHQAGHSRFELWEGKRLVERIQAPARPMPRTT